MSTAPPNSPASVLESPIENGMADDDILPKITTTLNCMLDAIGNAIGNNKLKSLFAEYRRKTEAAAQIDLKKCSKTNEDVAYSFV